MATHLPGVTSVTSVEVGVRMGDRNSAAVGEEVVQEDKIWWAVGSFELYKSPGEDRVYPVLLQQGLSVLLGPLTTVYGASIELGHILAVWRIARLVFLSKPGRHTHEVAKDYRPIILASFILKVLERLIDRFIRDGPLVERPLHPRLTDR